MDTTRFDLWNGQGKLLYVSMDETKILLPDSPETAIGTEGLNGCTCVVILGRAIILAHISPIPGATWAQWEANPALNLNAISRRAHEIKLREVGQLIAQHEEHFPVSTTVWGVFVFGRTGPIPLVRNVVSTTLTNMGYTMQEAFYRELEDPRLHRAPKGELVAEVHGNAAALFLEDVSIHVQDMGDADDEGEEPNGGQANIADGVWHRGDDGFELRARDGGNVLARQTEPPLDVPFFMNNTAYRWNGQQRLVFKNGAWEVMV